MWHVTAFAIVPQLFQPLLPKSSRKFSVSKDLTSTQSLTRKLCLYPYFGGYHSKFSTFASTYHHWQTSGQMHPLNELLEASLCDMPTMHSRDMFPNLVDLRVTWRKCNINENRVGFDIAWRVSPRDKLLHHSRYE